MQIEPKMGATRNSRKNERVDHVFYVQYYESELKIFQPKFNIHFDSGILIFTCKNSNPVYLGLELSEYAEGRAAVMS